MLIGTCYFPTLNHAARYYRDYEPGATWKEVCAIVKTKVDEGLIHLGTPPLKSGQRLRFTDSGLRYAIEESN